MKGNILKKKTTKIEEDKLTLFVSGEKKLGLEETRGMEKISKLQIDYDLLYNNTIKGYSYQNSEKLFAMF